MHACRVYSYGTIMFDKGVCWATLPLYRAPKDVRCVHSGPGFRLAFVVWVSGVCRSISSARYMLLLVLAPTCI